ncbi:MAG: universal stress protein [Thermomicrobiales bacterium]
MWSAYSGRRPGPSRSINHGLVAEYLAASREWTHEQLDELREQTAAAGYTVTSELRPQGNVVDEILDAAETSGSDAIAMCTHGMGGVGRLVIGSVADGVLRKSTKPVLLLRPSSGE